MSTQENTAQKTEAEQKKNPPEPVIHRVCVTCNNMFRVTPDHYDAKMCPNCHKEG